MSTPNIAVSMMEVLLTEILRFRVEERGDGGEDPSRERTRDLRAVPVCSVRRVRSVGRRHSGR